MVECKGNIGSKLTFLINLCITGYIILYKIQKHPSKELLKYTTANKPIKHLHFTISKTVSVSALYQFWFLHRSMMQSILLLLLLLGFCFLNLFMSCHFYWCTNKAWTGITQCTAHNHSLNIKP